MARISNRFSPMRRHHVLLLETPEHLIVGATIKLVKNQLKDKTGFMTADRFALWSVHKATAFVNFARYDPFPLTDPPILLQRV